MRVPSPRLLLATAVIAALSLAGSGCSSFDDGGPDVTGPAGPAGLRAAAAGRDIVITWTHPTDPDFAGVIIVAHRGVAPSGGPLAGVLYGVGDAVGNGVVIAATTGSTAIDSAPPPCPLLTYQAWAWDDNGNWSDLPQEASVAGGTIVAPPTQAPTGLGATVTGGRIALTWTNPAASTGFAVVRIVHASGSAPTGPTGGNLVYTGAGQATTDALVPYLPGDTQYYAAYACNGCGQCEEVGVATSVTPTIAQALTGGG